MCRAAVVSPELFLYLRQGELYGSAAAGAVGTAHISAVSRCAQGHFETHLQCAQGFAVQNSKLDTACETRNFSSKRKLQLCSSALL